MDANPSLENPYEPPTSEPPQFGVAMLIGMIAVVAVCLALMRVSPGLGILAFIVSAPAMVRAARLVKQRTKAGAMLGFGDRVAATLGSYMVMILVLVSGGAAFYGTCWGGFVVGAGVAEAVGVQGYDPIGWGLVTGVCVGGLVGIALSVWILKKTWNADWPHLPIDERHRAGPAGPTHADNHGDATSNEESAER